jgi:uncharacterized protein DUF3427
MRRAFLQRTYRETRVRRYGDKSGLTVLDFIGQQQRQFRFEPRLTALMRKRGHDLVKEIETGLPSLPAGCSMQLDRVATATIVNNIRAALVGMRRANLAAELRSVGDVSLAEFLAQTGHDLDEVYRSNAGWTDLRRLSGFAVERPPSSREGVRCISDARTDVFFVTLQKVERRFSPTTMYRDYAISPTLFHWESQSTTTERSRSGQRYIHHVEQGSSICIFARESSESTPFLFLGRANYVRHEHERPMQITWRMEHPMPSDFSLVARAAA